MNRTKALAILRAHNRWRRGEEGAPMTDPTLLGQAIDCVCELPGPDTTTMPSEVAVAYVRLAQVVGDVLKPKKAARNVGGVRISETDPWQLREIARAWRDLQRVQGMNVAPIDKQ